MLIISRSSTQSLLAIKRTHAVWLTVSHISSARLRLFLRRRRVLCPVSYFRESKRKCFLPRILSFLIFLSSFFVPFVFFRLLTVNFVGLSSAFDVAKVLLFYFTNIKTSSFVSSVPFQLLFQLVVLVFRFKVYDNFHTHVFRSFPFFFVSFLICPIEWFCLVINF